MKNLLSIRSLTKIKINFIMEKIQEIESMDILPKLNKILINVFLESSTRTSVSFETAMYKLGGNVITFNKDKSSINKGETLEDTIKTLSIMGDIMVLRTTETDLVDKIKNIVDIPIINGGDGNGEHPTQALLDYYTIYKYHKNKLKDNKLNILIVGDLDDSRTIHSLVYLLEIMGIDKITFYPYIGKNSKNIYDKYIVINNFDDINHSIIDVVYITRQQKEREIEKNNPNNNFVFDVKKASKFDKKCIFLHPLPRNNELSTELDKDKRSVYFEQIKNGINVRMALLYELLKSTITI